MEGCHKCQVELQKGRIRELAMMCQELEEREAMRMNDDFYRGSTKELRSDDATSGL